VATSKGEEGRDRAEDGTGGRGRGAEREGPERKGRGGKRRAPMTFWHGAPQCLNPALPIPRTKMHFWYKKFVQPSNQYSCG